MPNYNHGRYLEAALLAHLKQTNPPLEIIVVDDASTDGSCAIVERLKAEHASLRLVRLPENQGVNAAMNQGLREARGECICFSAADDLVTGGFGARSLQALAEHPTAALSFSDVGFLMGESGVVRCFPLFLANRPCMLSPADIAQVMKRDYFHLPSHTVIYRRALLLALGGFREDLHWIADWFNNYALAFRHGACYIPEVLVLLRLSPSSYSARGVLQRAAQRDLIYRFLDLIHVEPWGDLAGSFRASAIVPHVHLQTLLWLLRSRRHRGYLTARLVCRLLARGWIAYLPHGLRLTVRTCATWARRWRLKGRRPVIRPTPRTSIHTPMDRL